MATGHSVCTEEIRSHARNLEEIRARFAAVKSASAHIAQDDAAYGLLCGWISAILEERHRRQDELIACVEENLSLVIDTLHTTVANYEAVEADTTDAMNRIGRQLGGIG